MGELIAYVGPPTVHDAIIQSVELLNDRLNIILSNEQWDTPYIRIEFENPIDVVQNDPVGRELHSLAEFEADDGGPSSFEFLASEEDEPCPLTLRATGLAWTIDEAVPISPTL